MNTIALCLICLLKYQVAAPTPLLASLQGCWHGTAVKTPRGVVSYPLCFRHQQGETYGLARLDLSEHHWRFCSGGKVLNFLSTFRGNQQPVKLKLAAADNQSLLYRTGDPDFLRVIFRRHQAGFRISIIKRLYYHVAIELPYPAIKSVPASDTAE